jgi:tRNA(adenine34) deaminase
LLEQPLLLHPDDRPGVDQRFMGLALELARASLQEGEVPVGALLVVDGRVVGRGRNRPIALSDPTAHAEIQALRDAGAKLGNYRLPGAVLYSTVEPCLMCLGAMLHARIGRLVYGAADPKIGAVARLRELRDSDTRFSHDIETLGGILAGPAARLLLDFFEERRSTGSRRNGRAASDASG